jgi:hypothetical protein
MTNNRTQIVSVSDCPTPKQMREFWKKVELGQITRQTMQEILRSPRKKVTQPRKSSRRWRVGRDGAIYFEVTSDGTTGPDWIPSLEQCGVSIGDPYAKSVLHSPEFKPTNGTTYRIAVLPGRNFRDQDRTTANIRAEGDRRGWKHGKDISAEIAPLIRKKFTNKEINAMGLRWIIAMHEAITGSGGDPNLLGVYAGVARPWLSAYADKPGYSWSAGNGFAFVVSQVSIFKLVL